MENVSVELPLVETDDKMAEAREAVMPVHQSCRDCVFAAYTNKTQSGCTAGRLEKYREKEAVVSAYDDELEFDIINGAKCNYFRDKNSRWAKTTPSHLYASQVRQEIAMRVDAVIVISGENITSGQLLANLKTTLDSLKKQALSPSGVYVVNNQGIAKTSSLHTFLLKNAKGLNWSLTDIRYRTKSGKRPTPLKALDETFNKFKGHFYTLLSPGFVLPPTFVLDIDRAINDNMERFCFLEPVDHWNCLTAQNGFHVSYDGNNVGYGQDTRNEGEETAKKILLKNLWEKARFFADVYQNNQIIKKAADVCPALAHS